MPSRSDAVIEFIEKLTLPSGVGAGGKFKLRDWQKRFIREVYDPQRPDGRRLVRRAILSMARKNGKTMLIAALVLCSICGPEAIQNGEIISAANSREQASEVFKDIKQIVEADEDLQEILEVTESRKNIYCPSNGTTYRAISKDSKTKHGQNPSVIIFDEMAQSPKVGRDGVPTLYETLRSSQGAQLEPLFFVISTQSHDPTHPLSMLIDRGLATNDDGTKRDPETVCHLYAAPEDCDLMDPAAHAAANPAYGDFCSAEMIMGEAANANDLPSFEPAFRNLHLNQRVSPLAGLIQAADWRACYDPATTLKPGEDVFLGLDYADVGVDLCALTVLSANDGSRLEAFFWKPEQSIDTHAANDDFNYRLMVKQGHLLPCNGRTIEHRDVAEKIIELTQTYNVLGMAYDRYRVDLLLKYFNEVGFPVTNEKGGQGLRIVPFGQGTREMGPAIDAFERAVLNREIKHPGNPLLTWTILNALVNKPGHSGDRVLDKGKSKNRIDGAVATVMSFGLRAREHTPKVSNPWEDPNFSLRHLYN